MKQLWPIFYTAGSVLFFCAGCVGPDDGSSIIDWVIISVAFLTMSVAPLGLFAFGVNHSKKRRMPRPSMDRHCFGWWTDTLQPLRVSVLGTALYTLGAVVAQGQPEGQAGMQIYLLVATTIGMAIGERLVYFFFDNRIERRKAAGEARLPEH
jgi:hypothetical protein